MTPAEASALRRADDAVERIVCQDEQFMAHLQEVGSSGSGDGGGDGWYSIAVLLQWELLLPTLLLLLLLLLLGYQAGRAAVPAL